MARFFAAFSLVCTAFADDTCTEAATQNRAWRLRNRPVGTIKQTDLELVTEPICAPGDSQMLVKNLYISLDPTHRIWMSDKEQYMPKVELGEVMRAATVGVVEQSNHADYPVGTQLVGFGGVAAYYIGMPGVNVLYRAGETGLPLTADLSVASVIIGLTAYHGVEKILAPIAGDIVVVSGGAGAVGSLAGQLAKARGATVIGIAGSVDKCNWMTKDLGFDFAINYKTDDIKQKISEFAPEGITHYFDNVGGAVTDSVLMSARNNAKIALCGSISEYDDNWNGQKNYNMILMRRITVTGFICTDHFAELPEAIKTISGLVLEGKLKYEEDIRVGLEHYITAVNTLYTGANTGKLILQVE